MQKIETKLLVRAGVHAGAQEWHTKLFLFGSRTENLAWPEFKVVTTLKAGKQVLRLRDTSLAQMSPLGSPAHLPPLVVSIPEAAVQSIPNRLPWEMSPKLWAQVSEVFFPPP